MHIADYSDVSTYLWLRSELTSRRTDIRTDTEFQRRYRRYWQMNVARLSQRFYSRYFELLARYSSSQSVDVASLARELSSVDAEDEQSLQFSFASKLGHMIDPRLPVYDRFVAAFYFYVAPAGDGKFEARLVELMGFYNFLRHEYARVLGEQLLSGAIQKFRERFTDDFPDERIVDWLLWAWVSLLRRGAQRQGLLLYE